MVKKSIIGISLIQLLLGFEFIVSGLNKIVASPSFPTRLGFNLQQMLVGQSGWYFHFINNSIFPHLEVLGYLVEWFEFLAAIVLIAASLLFLTIEKENRVVYKSFKYLSIFALVGIFVLSLNYYFVSGTPSPLPGQVDPYGPAMSFDLFIVLMSLILIGWNATSLLLTSKRS